jgi:hypothetical protein
MNKATNPVEASHIDPSFTNLLQQHRQGGCLDELGQALRDVIDAAQLTGNPGVITLKLMIDPTKSGAMEIYDDLKVTMPKAEKVGSLFFVGEGGALVRNNPNQLEMPLRSIEGGAVVDVNNLRQVNQ